VTARALVLTVSLGLAAWLREALCPRTAWANNELFVADAGNNSVTVYSRSASGNIAPIRRLVGPATGLSQPIAVGVDTLNNELVVGRWRCGGWTGSSRSARTFWAPWRRRGA
jgi:hypothetical protein